MYDAVRAMNEGRWDEAMRGFTSACEVYPRNPQLNCCRIEAMIGLGMVREALAEAEHVIESFPSLAEVCDMCDGRRLASQRRRRVITAKGWHWRHSASREMRSK